LGGFTALFPARIRRERKVSERGSRRSSKRRNKRREKNVTRGQLAGRENYT